MRELRRLPALFTVGLAFACGKAADDPSAKFARTRSRVLKLAHEAYPQWAMRPSNVDKCPTLQDLGEFVEIKQDPWGADLLVRCDALPPGAFGVAIWSKGPDGVDNKGEGDDVRSWE